jgi:NAD(P)-dependent dehydrogenase (short-subunit alcohol dehydrogenase family)
VLSRTGRIDILVNNAGIAGRKAPVWEVTDEDWQQIIAIKHHGRGVGPRNLRIAVGVQKFEANRSPAAGFLQDQSVLPQQQVVTRGVGREIIGTGFELQRRHVLAVLRPSANGPQLYCSPSVNT